MTSTAIADDLELLLYLDRSAKHSLQHQLVEQIEQAIRNGQLAPGRRLPSTRALAKMMGISRNVVTFAYDELFARGAIVRKPGSGTAVNNDLQMPSLPAHSVPTTLPRWLRSSSVFNVRSVSTPRQAIVFQPGASDFTAFPLGTWRSIWKGVSNHLPPAHYLPRPGDLELRVAIAEYLKRSRGVICTADDVIITAGSTQSISLIARAILAPGEYVGFEEPGYMLARGMLQAQGASLIPIPVDNDGLQVNMLPTESAAPLLVYVTPSHQFPLGGRLPPARRIALLEWAQMHDSLIIEDDYDSEFRYGAAPLPTLISLDRHGCVVYLGTFSKSLSPLLRIGYMVAPAPLRLRIESLVRSPSEEADWPLQRAMLTCIKEGYLERHIRRMRRIYAEKRHLLGELLAPINHLAFVHGLEAGLHTYLELRNGLDARLIEQEASNRGVIVSTLAPFYLGTFRQHGLLLGYGGLTLSEITNGVTTLIDVIQSAHNMQK